MGPSLDVEHLVSLKGQRPAGMLQDAVDAGTNDGTISLRIACVERLEPVLLGSDAVGDAEISAFSFIKDLQFVHAFQDGCAFRRARHPVDTLGQRQCAVGLDLYEEACRMELIDERRRELQCRLTAGDNDVARFVPACLGDDVVLAALCKALMTGVAKGTTEVATGETEEESRRAGEVTLALKRHESLVYAQ